MTDPGHDVHVRTIWSAFGNRQHVAPGVAASASPRRLSNQVERNSGPISTFVA